MPTLPPARKPYPVKYPYRVRSDMYKFGQPLYGFEENALFIVDDDYEIVTQHCLELLKTYPAHTRAYITDDLDGLHACLWRVAKRIAQEMPDYASHDDDCYQSKLLGLTLRHDSELDFDPEIALFPELGQACFEHLKQLDPFNQFCDLLRLSIEEDIVIGRVTPALDADVMECMLVPIPSKWDPKDKIGLSFANVHAPIPHSERLVAAAPNLIKAIMTRGQFVRYNWTLGTDRWERNPAIEGADYSTEHSIVARIHNTETMLQRIYFRTERQTLVAFPDLNRYLFTIHTYIDPLADILTTPDRQQHFVDVLQSMPDDELEDYLLAQAVIEHLSSAQE